MEKEAEEERVRKQRAATERAFQDGIAKARLVMRRTPLGMDRNHNRSGSSSSSRPWSRSSSSCCSSLSSHTVCVVGPSRYWLFSDVVPGLYIEKGWVHESIDYSFTPPPEDKPAEPEAQEEEEDDEEEEEEGGGAANEGVRQQIHTGAIRNVSLSRRRCTELLGNKCAEEEEAALTSVCTCRS